MTKEEVMLDPEEKKKNKKGPQGVPREVGWGLLNKAYTEIEAVHLHFWDKLEHFN